MDRIGGRTVAKNPSCHGTVQVDVVDATPGAGAEMTLLSVANSLQSLKCYYDGNVCFASQKYSVDFNFFKILVDKCSQSVYHIGVGQFMVAIHMNESNGK